MLCGLVYNECGYDECSFVFLIGGINDYWFVLNLIGVSLDGFGCWFVDDIVVFLCSGYVVCGVVFGVMVLVVGESIVLLIDVDCYVIVVYLKLLLV